MQTGNPVGSLFMCGIAQAIRTRSGLFGMWTHRLRRLRPHHHLRLPATAVGLHQAAAMMMDHFASTIVVRELMEKFLCEHVVADSFLDFQFES